MRSHGMTLAILLFALAALCTVTSHAQTVTFSYSVSCNLGQDPNCPRSGLHVADGPGGTAGDRATIATVNSDVPGFTNPVPITGGLLNFESTAATGALCDPPPGGCYARYDIPGGSVSVAGAVFGLPDGATLLTASFLGGSQSHFDALGDEYFYGPVSISFINPVILASLGLVGAPDCGTGSLYDSVYYDYLTNIETINTSVTFTPGTCYSYSVLHNFTGGSDGAGPAGGLTFDVAGNLYGTAQGGGHGFGTVWRLKHTTGGWTITPLYQFTGGADGAGPAGGVVLGSNNTLYGTTQSGGNPNCSGNFPYPGCGTVFNLRPEPRACTTALCPWVETVLYSFTGGNDGANPAANVSVDRGGTLWGTTPFGGLSLCDSGCGTVFQLANSGGSWTENVLYSFTNGIDGSHPYGGVTLDAYGNLDGTTFDSPSTGMAGPGCWPRGCGVVFQLTPSESGWTETTLYALHGETDGGNSTAGVILDQSGNLYGATTSFGPGDGGTVFQLILWSGSWMFDVITPFDGGSGPLSGPPANLVMDQAGNLYGTTQRSGANGYGSVFKLTVSGNGLMYAPLYDFTGGSDGAYPEGSLTLDQGGNLYGTTSAGGTKGQGVVFQIKAK